MFDLTKPNYGSHDAAPYTVLYGQDGVGKTTFACLAPNSVVADTERGIPGALRQVPRYPIESMADLLSMTESLRTQQHTWTHYVIDTASALNVKMTTQVCREQKWTMPDGSNDMGERGFGGYGRGEKILGERWAVIQGAIQKLKEDRNIAITMTAHVRIAKVKPPDVDEYARFDLQLPNQAIEVIAQRADIVAYMSYPIVTIKDDRKQGSLAKALGDTDARLYLKGAATHRAKNRFELPDYLTIPAGNPVAGWSQFASRIPYWAPLFAQQPASAA